MMEKMRNKKKKGFTLIELIVVIVILAILALIAVPRLGGFTQSAKEKSADASAATIAKAIATWQADNPAETGPADSTAAGTDLDELLDLQGGTWAATYDSNGALSTVTYTSVDGTTLGYYPASDRP